MYSSLFAHQSLPYQTFFKPNEKFLKLISQYADPLLEAGCGGCYNLSKIREYGRVNNIPHMDNARGFDLHPRDKCDVHVGITFIADALDCSFYHKKMQILVCRPDHSGWVGSLLDSFLDGLEEAKRFIYVGLEENLTTDFTLYQLDKVSAKHTGVGSEEEVMYIWELDS